MIDMFTWVNYAHTHTHTHCTDTSDEASSATPTPRVDSVNHDIYFIIGIGVFVVAGVVLVIIVIVVICYCCLTRQRSSSQKAKKSVKASQAGVELTVGMTLSYPSPNIYTKRRESSSVSTDGHSSSPPISEGIPRAAYSSTSVWYVAAVYYYVCVSVCIILVSVFSQ